MKGFKQLIPSQELEKIKIETGLSRFAEILKRLLDISKKELANKQLKESDYDFIGNFGSISANLIENDFSYFLATTKILSSFSGFSIYLFKSSIRAK
ncbi:MAG: DUF3160 domain-containing protein [Elusimicrobiota bacterium]